MTVLERFVVLIYDRKAAFKRGLKTLTASPLEPHSSSTSKEQCSKAATYEAKPSFVSQCF